MDLTRTSRHRIDEYELDPLRALTVNPIELEAIGWLPPEPDPPPPDGEVDLIDETYAREAPSLDLELASTRERVLSTPSAVPKATAIGPSKATMHWGLGTDGWPRHRSRLVRLFFGDPGDLMERAAAKQWGRLELGVEPRQIDDAEHTLALDGRLQMPYPSAPLHVELRAQPFERRFTRVDLVLLSHRRFPRRFFDVASVALTDLSRA